MALEWIHTSVEIRFGGEDGGLDVGVRFRGHNGPAQPAAFNGHGDLIAQAEPATFEVEEIQWKFFDPDRWESAPEIFWNGKLVKQLVAIGIAHFEARDERDRAAASAMRIAAQP